MQIPASEADCWDKETTSYKRGVMALDNWHAKCRIRRLEAKINAARKAKGLPPLKKKIKYYGPED